MAFGWAVPELLTNAPNHITGGSLGLSINPPSLFGTSLSSTASLYYLIAVIGAVVGVGVWWLLPSRIGIAWRAIWDSEPGRVAMGLDPIRYRVASFALSAMVAGVAGCLYAYLLQYISPDAFGFNQSIYFLVAVVVGGLESVAATVFGGLFIVFIPYFFSGAGAFPPILFGISTMAMLRLAPGRLAEIWIRLRIRLKSRLQKRGDGRAEARS